MKLLKDKKSRKNSSRGRNRTTFWTFLVGLMSSWFESFKAVSDQGAEKLETIRTSVYSAMETVARNSNRGAVDQFFSAAKEKTNDVMRSSANAIDHALHDPAAAAQEAAAALRTTATETQAKAGEMRESATRGMDQVRRFSSGVKEALCFYMEDAQAMYHDAQRLYSRITDTPLNAPKQSCPLNMCCKPCNESSETDAASATDSVEKPPQQDIDTDSATTH